MTRKSSKTQQPQELYAAVCSVLGVKFTFHASSQQDATDKINGWNRYHSFTGEARHTARPLTADETQEYAGWARDEYIF